MATDIGPKIGIQGEAQFRRELGQINTDLKTLGSEMKLVTSEFIGNEQSTEALTAQNQVLEATIVELTQKQQLLQQQLVKTAAAYGSDSKQAQALQQQYNQTTAQINTMSAKVEENNSKINSNGSVLGKLSGKLGDVAKQFGLSGTAASKFTSILGSTATAYTAIVAAVVKLVSSLNDLAEKQAAIIDQVNTMATKYHTTSQAIDAFNYAAKFTDVSAETMLGSLSKLTKSMDAARDGSSSAAEAFKNLGVAVTDGNGQLRSSQAVFMEIIDALKNISNETERDAAAMEIFGKSATELNGVIEQGSEGLRNYMEEAAKFGVVISDAANENLQNLQNTKDQVDSIAEAAKTNAAAAFAPVSEELQNIRGGFWLLVNDLATGIAGFNDSGSKIVDLNGQISNSAKGAADEIKSQSDALEDAANSAKQCKNAYEEMLGIWDEMQNSGLGRVIRSYDPGTGILSEGIVTDQKLIDMYRTGQYSGSQILDMQKQSDRISLDVTLDLDGYTLGQAVTPLVNSRNVQRGNAF